MAGPRTDEKTPEQIEAAKKEREEKERVAVQKLREIQQNNAAENYKESRFWTHWRKFGEQPGQPDPQAPSLGSVPDDESPLLEPGTYEKRGINRRRIPHEDPLLVHFSYNEKTGGFRVDVDMREYTGLNRLLGGNHKKWQPKTSADFDRHAETTAKEAVKFLGGKGCFSKVSITFGDAHPFATGGGNEGCQTLAYAEKYVETALRQAQIEGVGIEISPNFLQAVQDKRGINVRARIEQEIAKANKNSEQHALLKGLGDPKALQAHQKGLQEAGALTAIDVGRFQEAMQNDIKAQKAAKADPERIKALEKKMGELKVESVDGPEDLLKLKEQWEDFKNPAQKFQEAVKELQGALKGVDAAAYKSDDEKAQLKEMKKIESELGQLEKKLATPLADVERKAVEDELSRVIAEMDKIAKMNPDFQAKCGKAMDKAGKLAKGEKGVMAAVQRIEGRVEKLQKAAAALHEAMDNYKNLDPQKLVGPPGMIMGKKVHVVGQSRFHRVENEGQAQGIVDKRFAGMDEQRQSLKSALESEYKKLEEAVKKLPAEDTKRLQHELQKVEKQLEAIKKLQDELEGKKVAKPGPGGSTVT